MNLLYKLMALACPILVACQTTLPLPATISLKWHETRRLEAANLEVRFESVTDSRCPIDAVCIWEGDGVASFSLKNLSTGEIRNLELHTNQGAGSDSVNLAGISVKMLELNPFPGTSNMPKLPEGYMVTLELKADQQPLSLSTHKAR
jgi:hypothetical protein